MEYEIHMGCFYFCFSNSAPLWRRFPAADFVALGFASRLCLFFYFD